MKFMKKKELNEKIKILFCFRKAKKITARDAQKIVNILNKFIFYKFIHKNLHNKKGILIFFTYK